MIRFPNPGSDVEQLIRIFKIIFVNLSEVSDFDLDIMANVLTQHNVASSSGFVGTQALAKSYQKKDKSRNPLYNQAKMYAEVYRFLGWIASTPDSRLTFKFTYLGYHVAYSNENQKDIFQQSLLGIEYPNQIINVKFTDINRPFYSILKFSDSLDSLICRDEILIGPMNLVDYRNNDEFNEKLNQIKELRSNKNYSEVRNALEVIGDSLNISVNTMHNYTRFVISSLTYSGWYEKVNLKKYDRKITFLKLTEEGHDIVNKLKNAELLSGFELEEKSPKKQALISRISLLQILKRADFNVTEKEIITIDKKMSQKDYIFSPYQYYSTEQVNILLPENSIEDSGEEMSFDYIEEGELTEYRTIKNFIQSYDTVGYRMNDTRKFIESQLNKSTESDEIVNMFLENINLFKQQNFYPLVRNLLEIIFNCDVRLPQAGVNNERFDVVVTDGILSIPVEVKSPTEEMMLSVKAIRQALENKIVMLSRYAEVYPTEKSVSSLAIGYHIPNKRSDARRLIEDIYQTFDINISIIDIKELISAAIIAIKYKKTFKLESFKGVRGVIRFENL